MRKRFRSEIKSPPPTPPPVPKTIEEKIAAKVPPYDNRDTSGDGYHAVWHRRVLKDYDEWRQKNGEGSHTRLRSEGDEQGK